MTGEALRRITPETAEILIEVTSTAPTASQALRDNYAKTTQLTQALGPLGVQQGDLQAVSAKVQSLYSPVLPSLPGFPGMPQLGHAGFPHYSAGAAAQPEVQFSSYLASSALRVVVRDPARVGEVADLLARSGATLAGGVRFRAADEANARKSALEAAARDARMKAETLATASGKQIGDPVAITEDLIVTNGVYAALRAAAPLAFGAAAPDFVGELEYYARVSASFRFA